MRNLLRCRRGSAAFATVVALIPLIGVLALGGEAGSWYVTQQRAQNAADAAAYSGGLQKACIDSGATCTASATTVDYSGKQFAAQNTFCNSGDTSYPGSKCSTSLPSGISQNVQIASLTTYGGTAGSYVKATVSQTQPAYLAKVLGLSTVTIGAIAVAKVNRLAANPPCVLALSGSLSFQGSPNINAQNCGMFSDSTTNSALDFTGGGMTLTGPLSAAGGCTGTTTWCNKAFLYQLPVQNPYAALDGALTTLCGSSPALPTKCGLPVCTGLGLVAYTASTPCTNDNLHITSNGAISLNGAASTCTPTTSFCVYFISGTLKITGTPTISGTATFILLPGATINNQGNAVINIAGPSTAPSSLPAALQSSASLFQYMSMYDASAAPVQFGGNTNINLTGTIYAPNAAVTFQGNPTINMGNGTSCGQLIAASVAFNGNATLDSSGCPSQVQVKSPPQYVQLVQ
ncbi:putative Flp pilus-assembly TadE/G-like protein [Bradyrhizobium macuxiense]|uniref:Putative Flp pilus-assembly TadE/G-like protein n=1 Tax=Bradyrhizobium macuxiense TaxID=1755647 RepID=A0A560KYX5_9BRAD|nr:pilus assembly protein TadG-related protein [Bradyrhizobium macuxiense]TWB88458.1 putative Flp pilus-assembly TadE/G-like protein [Bradyrhizobium macuxiense]